jgi:CoA:oxalate CoA-transferase
MACAKRHRIPLAPVREVDEIMRDRHMRERGMREWIEHNETGRLVVPTPPLRIHGADPVAAVPSPKPGRHNREIYGNRLGLSAGEIAALARDGVIRAGSTAATIQAAGMR